jgi:hypothetical protein
MTVMLESSLIADKVLPHETPGTLVHVLSTATVAPYAEHTSTYTSRFWLQQQGGMQATYAAR